MPRPLQEEDRAEPVIRRHVMSRRDEKRSRDLEELSASLAASITNTDGVLSRVVKLVSSFPGDTAAVRLPAEDGVTMRLVAAHDEDDTALSVIRNALDALPHDITRALPHSLPVREAKPVLLQGSELRDALGLMGGEHSAMVEDLGVHCLLFCPLRVHGHVIGTLDLWRRNGRGSYSQRDASFAQELADRAALAIENARLVERLRAEVEDRKHNEENLRLTAELLQRADEQRRALMENLVSAQEEERRRIAVDVHDDSIQAMAAIGLRLQILRRHAPNHEFAERISRIEDTVTESIGRLRSLLFRLESVSLEKVGLARTVERFAAELFPDNRPRFTVHSRLATEPAPHVQAVLYRIAQESLTNVQKHAKAAEVSVKLHEEDHGIVLSTQDDGVGFDHDDVVRRSLPGHMGLQSMQERASIAGGWLTVDSKPNLGTTVRCWVPV